MSNSLKTEALETWFRTNGGYLHESLRICHSQTTGFHLRTTSQIPPDVTIVSAPHSMTLSYLNALVDDDFTVFKQQRNRFKVEAIGFFYLMTQYIHRNKSFWKPYLDTLPQPDNDFSQPLFYEDSEDIAWLEGTDVWHTVAARENVYEQYYGDGIAVLREAGIDIAPYTWHLFKWSTIIFASRSFTSLSLLSTGSKYRTAYKSGPEGQREAVLLDMSGFPPEDFDFPVLFPGLDVANHSHEARVDWTFDPGRFSIRVNDQIAAGDEVFNNYGPKGNGELLIGYGFCISNNPYDTVALTPKEPPPDLKQDLKHTQPECFTAEGGWSLVKTTFRLPLPASKHVDTSHIFYDLPEPLLELLYYMLRRERELPCECIEQPQKSLTHIGSPESRYLPHIARLIAQFLGQKLTQLESPNLPASPRNDKQRHASVYRQGQIKIMRSYIFSLQLYIRSLLWNPSTSDSELPNQPCFLTLENFLQLGLTKTGLNSAFMEGIAASANTNDLEQLSLAGWEEDIWVLLWCYLSLSPDVNHRWLERVFPEYVDLAPPLNGAIDKTGDEAIRQAAGLLEIVRTAAATYPGSAWEDQRWSAEYIARVGGRILEHEGFMIGGSDGQFDGESRLYVYLHSLR